MAEDVGSWIQDAIATNGVAAAVTRGVTDHGEERYTIAPATRTPGAAELEILVEENPTSTTPYITVYADGVPMEIDYSPGGWHDPSFVTAKENVTAILDAAFQGRMTRTVWVSASHTTHAVDHGEIAFVTDGGERVSFSLNIPVWRLWPRQSRSTRFAAYPRVV